MLHAGHVILGRGVRDVENEEVTIRMAIWQQGSHRATLTNFVVLGTLFVDLGTKSFREACWSVDNPL